MHKPGTPKDHLETARAAWGEDMPEEVRALAEACVTLGSQRKVAAVIRQSDTVISCVLNRKYKGSYDNVFAAIRAMFLRQAVHCPGIDAEITGAQCTQYQRMESPSGSDEVRIYRACRQGCPHSTIGTYAHVRLRKNDSRAPESKGEPNAE